MNIETFGLYLRADVWLPEPSPSGKKSFIIGVHTNGNIQVAHSVNSGQDHWHYSSIKLLLRPLSSMTEEERTECFTISSEIGIEDKFGSTYNGTWWVCPKRVVYLLSKGFDLFGLIEKGEAIDSTKS